MDHSDRHILRQRLEEQLLALGRCAYDMHIPACPDPNEFASVVADMEINAAMRARASSAICDIDRALRKMDSVDYGFCEECGEEIGLARLLARPTATLCIHCQAAREGD